MATTRRESSADSAARFLALRGVRQTAKRRSNHADRVRPGQLDERIQIDFARGTLRAIHEVLCDAMAPREHRPENYTGDTLNRIVIAEQMVGRALGYPDCDDPPLTDRGATTP